MRIPFRLNTRERAIEGVAALRQRTAGGSGSGDIAIPVRAGSCTVEEGTSLFEAILAWGRRVDGDGLHGKELP